MNDLKVFIDDNPGHLTDEGPIDEVVVVVKALGLLPAANPKYPWVSVGEPTDVQKRLLRLLEQEGFVVAEGTLRRALPSEIGVPEAQSELMRLLDRHNLPVPKGHLDQALENHAAENWIDLEGVEIDLTEDYLGDGYGLPAPGVMKAIDLFARLEGIVVDPVYSAKAAAALIHLARRKELEGPGSSGTRAGNNRCSIRNMRGASGPRSIVLRRSSYDSDGCANIIG